MVGRGPGQRQAPCTAISLRAGLGRALRREGGKFVDQARLISNNRIILSGVDIKRERIKGKTNTAKKKKE